MILLLGSGYIASAFARELAIRKLEFTQLSRSGLDYSNYSRLSWYLRDHRFEFVINAAGYSGFPNVDACEQHQAETFSGNVQLPLTVAHACAAAVGGLHGSGIPFGHVSSGCMYNGPGPYSETDDPDFTFFRLPCSYYSGTKHLAEMLLAPFKECYLWRLRMPFDEQDHPKNYLSKILRYPKLISVSNSISHRGDFVKACLDLWQLKAPFGAYNMTNPGCITAGEIASLMNHIMKLNRKFTFFNNLEEFNATVRAPRTNCVLITDKLIKAGVKIRPVHDAVSDAISNWKRMDLPA